MAEAQKKAPSSLDVFGPSQKVAVAIGAFHGQEVVERVRESEHATEADIITFAETFLDGGYREKEAGKSFARLFERMLREGPSIIDKQLEAVQHERKLRQQEFLSKRREDIDVGGTIGDPDFRWILEMFGLGDLSDSFADEDESTAKP